MAELISKYVRGSRERLAEYIGSIVSETLDVFINEPATPMISVVIREKLENRLNDMLDTFHIIGHFFECIVSHDTLGKVKISYFLINNRNQTVDLWEVLGDYGDHD